LHDEVRSERSPVLGEVYVLRKTVRFVALVQFCLCSGIGGVNAASLHESPVYQLHLYNIHTRERLDVVYRRGEVYDPEGLTRINQYLRDYRTGDIRQYDPRVFDLLHDVMGSVGRADGQIEIVCGYRTPHTNEYLRTHGHGVARHSLHMQGMAIDIRVPGVTAAEIRDAAQALHRGGVGYYATSNFVHIDTGRIRRW
jgi:uncharacterized protein YcbK (DUF882 family)